MTAEENGRIKDIYLAELDRDGGAGQPIAGAQAFLNLVAASGRPVAVATGNWERAARWKLRAAGLDLDAIPMATSDDARERARILAIAIERAGPGRDPVYFGDGEHDRRTAAEAGVRFIHVGVGEGRDLADYTDTATALRLLNLTGPTGPM